MTATEKKLMVPKLRFPEFLEAWKSIKAGQAFKNRRKRGIAGLPIYSVTLDQGMVRRDSLDRQFGGDAADEANLRALPGDLVYNTMRMWQGAVGRCIEECMVSPAYVVLEPKKGTSSEFFDVLFKSHRTIYKLWAYSHGLTSDRLRLYFEDFAQIPFLIPSPSEQNQIASFFNTIDKKIKDLCKKRDHLTDYKRGLMQQIFSRSIRFSRDNGRCFPDWKEKKLGEVFDWVRTNSLSRDNLTCEGGGIQNIHYGDIHTKFKANFRQSSEIVPYIANPTISRQFSNEEFCKLGDVIIADASEDYADIGKAIEIVEVKPRSLVAGLHTHLARPKSSEIALGFPGYLLRSAPMRRQIIKIAQGISVLGISKTNLDKLTLLLPHPDEQRKIAHFLSTIDAKLDSVTGQIAQIEAFKKGLLQQMLT